jgi:plastocyanin
MRAFVGLCLTYGADRLRTSDFFGRFSTPMRTLFRTILETDSQNLTNMKTKKLLTVAAVSAGLAFSVTAQAKEEKHEEQSINSSDVPAAVQQAAQAEAKGGTIVRWEKEGANFEAVIEKNGKQIGVEMDANGKVLSKHNEAKEHKEKGEKY